MASSFKSPILQAIDQNGNPVPGAKLFAFASGTTTPVAIYSNQSLTTPLPNPLIANARGYFASAGGIVQNIWWGGQALRLRLTGPDDSVIWEIDDYSAASGADPAANINVTGIWAGANAKSLAALKARSVAGLTGGEVIQLNAGGRSGQFAWVAGNQSANVTADPQQGIWVAPDSDPTGASGAWRRLNVPWVDGWVSPDWFGAVGNGVTDDQPAFQAANDYLVLAGGSTGKSRGGTIQFGAKRYLLNSTFAITERGITLRGHIPERSGANTASAINGGVLIGGGLTGPVVGMWSDDVTLENVEITSTAARSGIRTVSTFSGNGTTVTAVTSTAHGLTTGDFVIIFGINQSGYNGYFEVTVVDATTFTYASTGTDAQSGGVPRMQRVNVQHAPRASNCGVSIETADLAGQLLMRPRLINVMVREQPGTAYLAQGEVVQAYYENCDAIVGGGHAYAQDCGDITGRTNKGRPGISNYVNCRAFDFGGHLLCMGHPDNGSNLPYRPIITNFEGFRSGKNPNQRYDAAGWFFFTENALVLGGGISGTSAATVPELACLSIGGRQNTVIAARYINAGGDHHVRVRTWAGLQTRQLDFVGGTVSSNASPTVEFFIKTDSNVRQISVHQIAGDFTSVIDNTSIAGLIAERPVTAGGWDILHRADLDFGTSGRIRNLRGNETTPFANLSGNEYIQLQGLDASTQLNGMFRITQTSGGSGDASIRFQVGSNSWAIGQRRSNNTFCIRNNTAFSASGNIVNIIGDGGTNGFVGIGPNTNVPAHRLDIDGSINVRTGGAFRFAGTQVVGARQIQAALANTANSGDANTDALITALKDIIIAHGLGAAS
jgi:hypothetical protein